MRYLAITLATALLLCGSAVDAQPMGGMMGNGPMMGNRAPRHFYVMRNGVPQEYRNLNNPLRPGAENLRDGKRLFQAQCVVCHGAAGRGDGPAAAQLNPPPTDLTWAVHTRIASDGFLFWTITDGGAPIGSAMPSFRSSLSPENIWKIILYLRQL